MPLGDRAGASGSFANKSLFGSRVAISRTMSGPYLGVSLPSLEDCVVSDLTERHCKRASYQSAFGQTT